MPKFTQTLHFWKPIWAFFSLFESPWQLFWQSRVSSLRLGCSMGMWPEQLWSRNSYFALELGFCQCSAMGQLSVHVGSRDTCTVRIHCGFIDRWLLWWGLRVFHNQLRIFIFLCLESKKVFVTQSLSDFCHPMECSPPDSSVHGISQARILEWVTISFSKGSSQPRDQTWVSCIAGRFFTVWATREAFLYLEQW